MRVVTPSLFRSTAIILVGSFLLGNALSGDVRGQASSADDLYGDGVHSFFSGRYAQAEKALTRAIHQSAQDPRAYFFRGLTNVRVGRADLAKQDFQRGAALEQVNSGRSYDVGLALERIQGGTRYTIEKYRAGAKLAAQRELQKQRYERYERIRRAEPGILRRPEETANKAAPDVAPAPAGPVASSSAAPAVVTPPVAVPSVTPPAVGSDAPPAPPMNEADPFATPPAEETPAPTPPPANTVTPAAPPPVVAPRSTPSAPAAPPMNEADPFATPPAEETPAPTPPPANTVAPAAPPPVVAPQSTPSDPAAPPMKEEDPFATPPAQQDPAAEPPAPAPANPLSPPPVVVPLRTPTSASASPRPSARVSAPVMGHSVGNALLQALKSVANQEVAKRAGSRREVGSPFANPGQGATLMSDVPAPLAPDAAPIEQPETKDTGNPFDNAPRIKLPDVAPPTAPPASAPNNPGSQPTETDPFAPMPN